MCLVTFLDLNGIVWDPDAPNVDEAESAVLSVASHSVDEAWLAKWIRDRTHFSE